MKVRQVNVCDNCRRRKLGCDGRRPNCSQCAVGKLQCTGYQHELIFVDSVKGCRVNSRHKGQRTSYPTSRTCNSTSRPTSDVRFRSNIQVTHISNCSPPITAPLSWPIQEVISLVVQSFAPDSILSSKSSTSPSRICGSWVEVLPALANNETLPGLLESAIKALAVSIHTKGYRGRAPISDALQAHASAVCRLRHAIHHGNSVYGNELAATIMCLFLSESLIPTSDISALAHAEGISKLMQDQTPRYFSRGIPHRLFVGFRPILLLHAFMARKSTFLSEEEWKTIPFRTISPAPLQDLFSRASPIPSILEQMDKAQGLSSDAAMSTAHSALLHFSKIVDSLNQWHFYFRNDSQEPRLYWQISRNNESLIWYPSITIANALTHFWAFWIICVTGIRALRHNYPCLKQVDLTLDNEIPENTSIRERIVRFSMNIMKSIEYIVQDEHKLFGVGSVALPLNTARQALNPQDNPNAEVRRIFQGVTQRLTRKGSYFPDVSPSSLYPAS